MHVKHRVQICVADNKGKKQKVLGSTRIRLPKRLLKWMFGEFCEVLVLTPGESVENIEIHEVKDGDGDEK